MRANTKGTNLPTTHLDYSTRRRALGEIEMRLTSSGDISHDENVAGAVFKKTEKRTPVLPDSYLQFKSLQSYRRLSRI